VKYASEGAAIKTSSGTLKDDKMTNEVLSKVNELATAVIPQSHLSDSLALPLKEQVFGIKFFATISTTLM